MKKIERKECKACHYFYMGWCIKKSGYQNPTVPTMPQDWCKDWTDEEEQKIINKSW